MEGEERVLTALCERLGDDWRALGGYKNRAGEIDLLLLGPRGVFALEIKNINRTIVCHGDHWHGEKYDNYGKLVDERAVTDNAGRSPSQELNEPTDQLTAVLAAPTVSIFGQKAAKYVGGRSRSSVCGVNVSG